ncbi:hypothetical protein IWX48DRAFT_122860 [Phyllosticta citricarpa]
MLAIYINAPTPSFVCLSLCTQRARSHQSCINFLKHGSSLLAYPRPLHLSISDTVQFLGFFFPRLRLRLHSYFVIKTLELVRRTIVGRSKQMTFESSKQGNRRGACLSSGILENWCMRFERGLGFLMAWYTAFLSPFGASVVDIRAEMAWSGWLGQAGPASGRNRRMTRKSPSGSGVQTARQTGPAGHSSRVWSDGRTNERGEWLPRMELQEYRAARRVIDSLILCRRSRMLGPLSQHLVVVSFASVSAYVSSPSSPRNLRDARQRRRSGVMCLIGLSTTCYSTFFVLLLSDMG